MNKSLETLGLNEFAIRSYRRVLKKAYIRQQKNVCLATRTTPVARGLLKPGLVFTHTNWNNQLDGYNSKTLFLIHQINTQQNCMRQNCMRLLFRIYNKGKIVGGYSQYLGDNLLPTSADMGIISIYHFPFGEEYNILVL
jgi:hypothetical protein